MTIPEKVNTYVGRHAPHGLCDDCIASGLALKRRQQAHRVTSALATTSDFDRAKGPCHLCGDEKLVIRAR